MSDENVITVENRPEVIVATIQQEELDYDSSGALRSEVVKAGAQNPNLPLLLDMSGVSFVPSVALGALITLTRLFKEGGQRFVLVGVRREIRDMIAICHLDRLFEMHETSQEAIEHLRA